VNLVWWILTLAVGVLIGSVVTWLYFKLQHEQAERRIEELEAALHAAAPAAASTSGGAASTPSGIGGGATATAQAMRTFDAAAAKTALGRTVREDDLTVIDGIGPKIAGLLHADGIATWAALSKADVGRLQRILDGAGPRYRTYRPDAWPRQAGLLAHGRFAEFSTLADDSRDGK
jgi:predicted flap endonuclease-1-like 5' DNA nuclease